MRRLLPWLVLALVGVLAAPPTPVHAAPVRDDCFWMAISLDYQTDQRNRNNADLAYAQLQVSWDIQEGRGPGDPIFDHDVNECIQFGGFADYWQRQMDATAAAMHDAHCM